MGNENSSEKRHDGRGAPAPARLPMPDEKELDIRPLAAENAASLAVAMGNGNRSEKRHDGRSAPAPARLLMPDEKELDIRFKKVPVLRVGMQTEPVECCNIDLKRRHLERIPPTLLAEADHINSVVLSDNPGIRLGEDIRQFRNVTKLSLCQCMLKIFPEELLDLSKLQQLDVSGNELTLLPDAIGRLDQLQQLNVSGNKLTLLPEAIGRLDKLQRLYVFQNNLTALPEAIGRLNQLQKLHVSRNKLTSLPEAIGRLDKLQKLHVSRNKLTSLPEAIGRLDKLRSLSAGNNEIKAFPDAVLGLKKLLELDLSNKVWPSSHSKNSISELPVNLLDLTELKLLKLDGNPMRLPPLEVCKKGVGSVRAYLSDITKGRASLLIATFSLLGETGAGKTSLVRSLKAGAPSPTAAEDRTRVMEQHRIRLPTASQDGSGDSEGLIVFNDFGGHAIYQAVLPTLLPPRGTAVIVYDVTQPGYESTVEKWLSTALAAVPDACIVIVGTHCDQLQPSTSEEASAHAERMASFYSNKMTTIQEDLEGSTREVEQEVKQCSAREYPALANTLKRKLNQLQQLHGMLLRCVEASPPPLVLSCAGDVMSSRLDILYKTLASIVSAPPILPASWCCFITELLESTDESVRNSTFLTFEAVEKLFSKHFLLENDKSKLRLILVYLMETSQVIWLKNHPKLSTIVFHRVDHVIEIFKAVLHHDDLPRLACGRYAEDVVKYKLGFLSERLLHHMLSNLVSEHCDATMLVDLLQEFRLLSLVSGEARQRMYIIPSKLPPEPQTPIAGAGSESSSSCVRDRPVRVHMQLSFSSSVMPLAFFETSQAIVLQFADQQNVASHATCWKDGVSFCTNGVTVTSTRAITPNVKHGFMFDIRISSDDVERLWKLAKTLFDALALHWTTAWKGCWYEVHFLCPSCEQGGRSCEEITRRRCELDYHSTEVLLMSSGNATDNVDDLYSGMTLINRDRRGCSSHKGEVYYCQNCRLDVPLCLLSICSADDITVEDKKLVAAFVQNCGVTSPERRPTELQGKFKKARSTLISHLDIQDVIHIAEILYQESYISEEQYDEIRAEADKKIFRKTARCLVDMVERSGDAVLKTVLTALESEAIGKRWLAEVVQHMQP